MTGDGAVVRCGVCGEPRPEGARRHIIAGSEGMAAIRQQAAEIERLTREVQRRDLLLQNMTPGGSEYVNDPERCAAYAKEVRTGHFERWKKAALDLKASEARAADLLKALRSHVICETYIAADRIPESNDPGGSCLHCGGAWPAGGGETHKAGCIAAAKGETV